MTNSKSAERRTFVMHPNLLFDVITKQAGTLQKAILEGVMNGVDAGATRIDISIDTGRVIISDNGKGFTDRHEIEQYFETFGTPHEEGDAVYGRFRMGRGQMMAFGVNQWTTNTFVMQVDIKNKGLDYDLVDSVASSKAFSGCRIKIDLYDALLPSDCDSIQRDLKQWVAYVGTPVYLNDRLISEDPSSAKWDVETDDAWFKLAPSKGTLAIYNLGVLVTHAPAHRFGTGGVVVSKSRLDVNFARNDVQNTCKVFAGIKAELRRHSDTQVTRKKRITEYERAHLAGRILEGSVDPARAIEVPVITDVEGRHLSLNDFARRIQHAERVFATPRGNRQAITVAQQILGTAVAQETLDRFDAKDIYDFIAKLRNVVSTWAGESGSYRDNQPYNTLRAALAQAKAVDVSVFDTLVTESFEPIPEKKLNPRQKILRRVLEAGMYPIAEATRQRPRKIGIGHSDVAQAWTDGVGHVWFNENMLPLIGEGYQGCTRLAALMLHEFMHEGPDTDTHEHDGEFYKRHHDLSLDTDAIGKSVASMMRYLAYDARKRGKAPVKRVSLFEDMEARIVQEGGSGSSGSEEVLALVQGSATNLPEVAAAP
ncbi:ATP-binding protein [Sphingomonas sp. 3-13AW]|uniref:ATP-binding protein n=1 Tax=Sphingomonas sp. 3-13AW TaxID=3050450 RepID=UPI003BB4FF11